MTDDQDGFTTSCPAGTVCQWNLGNNPCVRPEEAGTVAAPQDSATSSQAIPENPVDSSAAPTKAAHNEEHNAPSATPTETQAPNLPAAILKLPTSSNPVEAPSPAKNPAPSTSATTEASAEASSTSMEQPSSTGQAAVASLSDPGVDGYATFHPAGDGDSTACGDVFGDYGHNKEAYYVAVSTSFWVMNGPSDNPNKDPICSHKNIIATYEGRSVTFAVRDKCMGCEPDHIDMAPEGFMQLFGLDKAEGTFGTKSTETSLGRNKPFSWKFVDAQPRRELVLPKAT
ncbi:hypothetical protein QFC21_004307 [Naganishia friedmannii]|uniref:Uncharacterized protein n=1 Tax=Naganishia friedmannii TaxID=89922 RepID=A0ACC2VHL5_9TREE|nr:hypothetical protein QFC21_004307 [Naganishia friedmannii]